MNPRERILAAFNHEKPDRTPTDGWFHPVIRERLKEYCGTDQWSDVEDFLGIEGWSSAGVSVEIPEFEAQATERPGGKEGPEAIWLDERTYKNKWGVVHRFGEGDWYQERIAGPLEKAETPDDILAYKFPTADNIRARDNYAEVVQQRKDQGLFVVAGTSNPYKNAWLLRGMENILADYLINQELLEALYDKLYGLFKEICLTAARAKVDMMKVVGDLAMQDRIVMGPEPWRKIDKPRMADVIQSCKEVNPDMYFFIHSDGNNTDLMDDFVEIGFDVINPIQPECMDPVEVKKRWGDKITIHGGVSLQRTLPDGTTDEVREEVEELIRNCGYDGGLVVFPSNVIQPDTPLENVIACFHAARDYKLR